MTNSWRIGTGRGTVAAAEITVVAPIVAGHRPPSPRRKVDDGQPTH